MLAAGGSRRWLPQVVAAARFSFGYLKLGASQLNFGGVTTLCQTAKRKRNPTFRTGNSGSVIKFTNISETHYNRYLRIQGTYNERCPGGPLST